MSPPFNVGDASGCRRAGADLGETMSDLRRAAVERAVAQIDERLAAAPDIIDLRFDRAQLLELLGCPELALRDYMAVLERAPAHVEALNALGLLFLGARRRSLARTLLAAAVTHAPNHAAAQANLAYLDMLDGNLDGARIRYEAALRADPTLAIAYHGLAELAERCGHASAAAAHRAQGLRYRPITIHRYTGTGRPVHILTLSTAALGNIAAETFFDSGVFLLASVVVDNLEPGMTLPPHDLVFNIIGEPDLCARSLNVAAQIIERTDAPVLNPPQAVAATSRADNARRLRAIPGVVTPRIERLPRSLLAGAEGAGALAQRGFEFPFLMRSPGFHTGEYFVKVDRLEELPAAVAALPGDELLVIEYLDVRDASGYARKYRVMIVDGRLYPLHLALSREWKVHYFSADMALNARHRALDAAFLSDMDAAIGAPAVGALERIRIELALDYGGIDFALDSAGNVIVFEANASMIVPVSDSDAKWDYRRAPVARIHAAVRAMLLGRARLD